MTPLPPGTAPHFPLIYYVFLIYLNESRVFAQAEGDGGSSNCWSDGKAAGGPWARPRDGGVPRSPPAVPRLVALLPTPVTAQYLALVPVEFHPILSSPFLQFVKIILNSNPVLQDTCSPSQLRVICKFNKRFLYSVTRVFNENIERSRRGASPWPSEQHIHMCPEEAELCPVPCPPAQVGELGVLPQGCWGLWCDTGVQGPASMRPSATPYFNAKSNSQNANCCYGELCVSRHSLISQ